MSRFAQVEKNLCDPPSEFGGHKFTCYENADGKTLHTCTGGAHPGGGIEIICTCPCHTASPVVEGVNALAVMSLSSAKAVPVVIDDDTEIPSTGGGVVGTLRREENGDLYFEKNRCCTDHEGEDILLGNVEADR
jgi:hypothetical protein